METITNDCRAWSPARDQSRQGGFNDVRHAKVPYVARIPDLKAAKIRVADYIDPAGAWQAYRLISFTALVAAGFALIIVLCWQLQVEQESEMGQKKSSHKHRLRKCRGMRQRIF